MSCLTRKGNEVNLSEYLEKVLLSEKTIHVLAASESSSIGKTVKKPEPYVKVTPHKDRLTALHAIYLQIFRHSTQKSLDIHEYACGIFMHPAEKSDSASDAQSLCGIALKAGLSLML